MDVSEMIKQGEVSTTSDQTTQLYSEDDENQRNTHLIVYILIGSLGVLGNGFALIVIATNKKMRQKVCNFFILNQSILDFLASFFLIINNQAITSLKQPSSASLAQFYCKIWASSFFLWTMMCASSSNLVAITIERYVAIVHSLSYPNVFSRQKAQFGLAIVWIVGNILGLIFCVIPSFAGLEGICIIYQWPDTSTARFFGILLPCILVVVPVCIMAFSYTKMMSFIKKRVGPGSQGNVSAAEMAREVRNTKAQRNLLKTMVIVCVVYFFCWILNALYILLANLNLGLSYTSTFYSISNFLAFINCIVNPVIYTAQYQEFQNAVKAKLQCLTLWSQTLCSSNITDETDEE